MKSPSRPVLIVCVFALCSLAALFLWPPSKGQAVTAPQYIDLGECTPGNDVDVSIRLLNSSSREVQLVGVELY